MDYKCLSIPGYLRICFPLNLSWKEDEKLFTYVLLSVVPTPLFCAQIFQLGCYTVVRVVSIHATDLALSEI